MYIRKFIYLVVLLLSAPTHAASNETEYKVPFQYGLGKNLYDKNCASCHGKWAGGTDMGPPFIHRVYVPSHHGDAAFYRAALSGARAHHWKFGDMAPVPGITREKLDKVIPYIRWLQKQNGIQ